eukprot:SAG31_NODE_1156_length_9616_cov_26.963014_8_plen_76_part_00
MSLFSKMEYDAADMRGLMLGRDSQNNLYFYIPQFATSGGTMCCPHHLRTDSPDLAVTCAFRLSNIPHVGKGDEES